MEILLGEIGDVAYMKHLMVKILKLWYSLRDQTRIVVYVWYELFEKLRYPILHIRALIIRKHSGMKYSETLLELARFQAVAGKGC